MVACDDCHLREGTVSMSITMPDTPDIEEHYLQDERRKQRLSEMLIIFVMRSQCQAKCPITITIVSAPHPLQWLGLGLEQELTSTLPESRRTAQRSRQPGLFARLRHKIASYDPCSRVQANVQVAKLWQDEPLGTLLLL